MSKLKNKKLWLIVGIFLVILILLFVFVFRKTDGMANDRKVRIYYQVHTKDGWSKYAVGGLISGDEKTVINGVNIKNKSRYKGEVYIRTYTNGKWNTDCFEKEKCTYKQNIKGIKVALGETLGKKNDVYYRVHTQTGKWLSWVYNGESAGLKDSYIDAIQIKIVPKFAYLPDYIKNYKNVEENTNNLEE